MDKDTQIARQAHELGWRTRQNKKDRNRITKLENAIRKHAEQTCDCPNQATCLARLYRLIPLR